MTFLSHEYSRLKEGTRVQDFLAGVTPAVVGMVVLDFYVFSLPPIFTRVPWFLSRKW